jgi:predicted amidohydrolase
LSTIRVALVQLDAGKDKSANIESAFEFIARAASEGAELIALPENFHIRTSSAESVLKLQAAESIPGPLSARIAEAAKEHGVYLLAGSYGERISGRKRFHNTSLFFDPAGRIIAKYRKIHLFDVSIGNEIVTQESQIVAPGGEVVVAKTDFGTVGLSICYDVRFPELYRSQALLGAVMSFVPANFTMFTGRDHWETLLRARAIENGMFMIAPAQIGRIPGGHLSYGRSMVVDPWGIVIAKASDRTGITHVVVNTDLVRETRRRLPSLDHRKPGVYFQDSQSSAGA